MKHPPQTAVKLYETGNDLYQKGRLAESEISYRKAIKIYRDFAEAYNNLGNVLKDLGRLKEAAGAYRKALKIYPNHPLLLNNLGNIFQFLGESQKALQYLKEAISQEPNYTDAHNNLGNVLKELGQLEDAADCYKKVLSINPDSAEAHNNLGNVLNAQGKIKEAIAAYQCALEINPSYIDACNNLGVALQDQNTLEEAISLYRRILLIDPNNTDAYNNLGASLREQGDLSEAVATFQRALAIDPNFKQAYLNLGITLRAQGNMEKAMPQILHALAIDPEYPEAHHTLSSLERHTEYDQQMQTMEALISRRGLSDNQKMYLSFGLGKSFEDINEYDRAFDFLVQGNRLKRATIEYSSAETRNFFEKIKNTFSADYFSSYKDVGFHDETPIFILGMPRSGTSLTEQILASHPQVFGAGELKVLSSMTNKRCVNKSDNNYPECILNFDAMAFAALGSDYINAIREHSHTSMYITDKMPHNFIYVGLIKLILPNAKIIHCTRDPMDNCLSIFKNLFGGPHPYAYDMKELGEYYKLYQDLMEHMRKTFPGVMYDLRYEDMISDQVEQTRQLLGFCGLPWDESCLSFHKTKRTVRTISATQVRRAIYKDSVQLWRRYETQLEPLRLALYG